MENPLPEEIISDILSRLPTESVLQCRRVCGTWRTLIRHPYFAQMHLQRLLQLEDHKYQNDSNVAVEEDLSFIFDIQVPRVPTGLLYYGEYGGNSYKNFKKINQPFIRNDRRILGSCNGLICFCETDPGSGIDEPVYISNPITREYVNLPRLNISNDMKVDKMLSGFGYHPSSKEYKVVKIYYISDKPLGQVQVYTLGNDSQWRDIEQITYSLAQDSNIECFVHSIFVNGAIHWLDQEEKIVAFDLADEVFHELPSPPCVRTTLDFFHLRELGGCLSVLHYEKSATTVAVWLLKKKNRSSKYDMKEDSWSNEFTIAIGDPAYPFSITNSGEVLLWYNPSRISSSIESILCRYDPKAAILDLVDNPTGSFIFTAIPHMNSLVSLRALGLKCRLRKRYYKNQTPNPFSVKLHAKKSVLRDC